MSRERTYLSSPHTDPIKMRIELFQAIKSLKGGSNLVGPFAHLALVHPINGYEREKDITKRVEFVVSYEFRSDAEAALRVKEEDGLTGWSIKPIHPLNSGEIMTSHFVNDGNAAKHDHDPNNERGATYDNYTDLGIELEYRIIPNDNRLLPPGEEG